MRSFIPTKNVIISFSDTATSDLYPLSLHDALPISTRQFLTESLVDGERSQSKSFSSCARIGRIFSFSASSPLRFNSRSEERFSRNAETDLVCRLLLEKKKKQYFLLDSTQPRYRSVRSPR